jgi:hypothetical protein
VCSITSSEWCSEAGIVRNAASAPVYRIENKEALRGRDKHAA